MFLKRRTASGNEQSPKHLIIPHSSNTFDECGWVKKKGIQFIISNRKTPNIKGHIPSILDVLLLFEHYISFSKHLTISL